YQADCLGCHGYQGNAVKGAALGSCRFRRGRSDGEPSNLIRTGIPGTVMIPRPQLSHRQLFSPVAFLRTLRSQSAARAQTHDVAIGDARRAEPPFFGSAGCNSCHGVGGGGSRVYPDLAGIGSQRTPVSLENALIAVDAEVREG